MPKGDLAAMIISHRHQFIFVHTRKSAGSSVKVTLAPLLGDEDVVIGSWNEILDANGTLNGAGRAVLQRPKSRAYYWAARAKGKTRHEAVNIAIKGYYRKSLGSNPPHPPATKAKRRFPDEWHNYFKFAFVRNPWERAASDYLWRGRATGRRIGFRDFLLSLQADTHRRGVRPTGTVSSWEMIAEGADISVDYVGRYEQLDSHFRDACLRIGIELEGVGARAKEEPDQRDYSSLYGPREKAIVREIFGREIEAFGYEFPY